MKFPIEKICLLILVLFINYALTNAQSRRSVTGTLDSDGTMLSVVASRTDKRTEPIKIENLYLYENGIEQKIKNFTFDPSPAKILLMVDNSQTVRADVELLKRATLEFAYEIFDGDQLFIVGYDEKPESFRNGRTTRKR
jgi:hypothetical protein